MTGYMWSAISLFVGVNALVTAGFGGDAVLWSLFGALSLVLAVTIVEVIRRSRDQ